MEENTKTKFIIGDVPDNCNEPKVVGISEFSITYRQPADTNSTRDEVQYLTVSASNTYMGDEGFYYDISTRDGHWSIEGPEDIADIINDFKERLLLNITKEKDLKASQMVQQFK